MIYDFKLKDTKNRELYVYNNHKTLEKDFDNCLKYLKVRGLYYRAIKNKRLYIEGRVLDYFIGNDLDKIRGNQYNEVHIYKGATQSVIDRFRFLVAHKQGKIYYMKD